MNDRTMLSSSRWRIQPFELIQPTTLDAAVAAADAVALPLAACRWTGPSGYAQAGGQVAAIVALSRVRELQQAAVNGDWLFLGAGLTHQTIATLQLLRKHSPALADAWGCIGNLRIRSRGTLGGLLAGQPIYKVASLLAALARALFAHGSCRYRVPIDGQSLPADLMLGVGVQLASCRLYYERSLRPGATLALAYRKDESVRIAIGGMAPLPLGSIDTQLRDLTWPPTCAEPLRAAMLTLIRRMCDANTAL